MREDEVPPTLSRRQLMKASATAVVAAKTATIAAGMVVADAEAAPATTTAEKYILTRLSQNNCKRLFGVPGATCSPIFEAAHSPSDVSLVVTSSDLGAGYAADGYARVRGLAAVSGTQCVGPMRLAAPIARGF